MLYFILNSLCITDLLINICHFHIILKVYGLVYIKLNMMV